MRNFFLFTVSLELCRMLCLINVNVIIRKTKYRIYFVAANESGLVRLWRSKEEDRLELNVIDIEVESSGKLKAGKNVLLTFFAAFSNTV